MRSNFYKIILLLTGISLLIGCSCNTPLKITSIQRGDKKLACKDIILEINEAEHYRAQAESTIGISPSEALSPMCWVTGYTDGSKAVKTAKARVQYLGNIYELLDCGGSSKGSSIAAPVRAPLPIGAPPSAGSVRAPTQPITPPGFPPSRLQRPQGAPFGAPPAGFGQQGSNFGSMAPPKSRANSSAAPVNTSDIEKYYKRIPIDQANGDTWLHEHKDSKGATYTHSHPHRGPHRHAEDF